MGRRGRGRVENKMKEWRRKRNGGSGKREKKGDRQGERSKEEHTRGKVYAWAHLYSLFSFFFIRARNVLCEQIESRWLPLNAWRSSRRVRALHLVPCCILHTYSIGCAASQRNNIATIHHTSIVNKISASFYHPRSLFLCRRSYFLLVPSIFFCYLFPPSLSIFPPYMRTSLRASIALRSFSLSDSNHVFATSAYLFDFFLLFARPLYSIVLFCASHFLFSCLPSL